MPDSKNVKHLDGADLLDAQNALIQAQQEFIRLQQHAIFQHLKITQQPPLALSSSSIVEGSTEQGPEPDLPVASDAPADLAAPPPAGPPSAVAQVLSKYAVTGILPLVLVVVIVALVLRGPREAKVLPAREAVPATRQPSQPVKDEKPSPATPAPENVVAAEPARPVLPLSAKEILDQEQQELRNARTALANNQRALVNNLREYRATASTLAKIRQGIFQTGLEIRLSKQEITQDELKKQVKPWEDFLPHKARALLADPRLNFDTVAAPTATTRGNDTDQVKSESDVPATRAEVQALLNKTVSELTVVMKQLTNTQAEIIQTQADLTAAQSELARVSQELRSQQNAAAVQKPAAPVVRR